MCDNCKKNMTAVLMYSTTMVSNTMCDIWKLTGVDTDPYSLGVVMASDKRNAIDMLREASDPDSARALVNTTTKQVYAFIGHDISIHLETTMAMLTVTYNFGKYMYERGFVPDANRDGLLAALTFAEQLLEQSPAAMINSLNVEVWSDMAGPQAN